MSGTPPQPPDPDPAPPPPPASPAPAPTDPHIGGAEIIGAVGSLVTLLTAVLFYFGWASTDAETKALGLHRWATNEPERLTRAVRVLRFAGTVPLVLVPLYPLSPWLFDLLLPLTTIAGLSLNAYARTRGRRDLRLWGLTLFVCVLSLFWAVSAYAQIAGRGRAELTERTVRDDFPAVTVLSEKDLMIRGGGSCFRRVTEKGSQYAYEYGGLRLFHVSKDRVFLVPRDWTPGHGTLYVLKEGKEQRVDLLSFPGHRERECRGQRVGHVGHVTGRAGTRW